MVLDLPLVILDLPPVVLDLLFDLLLVVLDLPLVVLKGAVGPSAPPPQSQKAQPGPLLQQRGSDNPCFSDRPT